MKMKTGHYVLIVLICVCLGIFFTSKRSKRDLKAELELQKTILQQSEEELKSVKLTYQIEETEECLDKTIELIKRKARIDREIDQIRKKKNEICGSLDNPTDQILNPQKYFKPIIQDDGTVTIL